MWRFRLQSARDASGSGASLAPARLHEAGLQEGVFVRLGDEIIVFDFEFALL